MRVHVAGVVPAILLGLLVPCCVKADELPEATRRIIPSVALIDVNVDGGGRGTGFVVAGHRVLTNEHIVRDRPKKPEPAPIIVRFRDGTSRRGAVTLESQALDLAVIQLDPDDGAIPPPLSLAEDNAPVGRLVALLGRGGVFETERIDFSDGRIKQVITAESLPGSLFAPEPGMPAPRTRGIGLYLVKLDSEYALPGMSGSPLYDERSKVVGIFTGLIVGEDPLTHVVQRAFYCIPSGVILEFLAKEAAPVDFRRLAGEGRHVKVFGAGLKAVTPDEPGLRAAERFRVFSCRHSTDHPLDSARWFHISSTPQHRVAARLSLDDRLSRSLFNRFGPVQTRAPGTLMRNTTFSYAVVVPDGFNLSETLFTDEKTLVSVYDNPAIGRVRITARKVVWPWIWLPLNSNQWIQNDGPGLLSDLLRKFRRQDLRIRLPQSDDDPRTYDPNEPRVEPDLPECRLGGLNQALGVGDQRFGVTALGSFYYRYYHYEMIGQDLSMIVEYVLSGDNLIVVDFAVPSSKLADQEGRDAIFDLAVFAESLLVYPAPQPR